MKSFFNGPLTRGLLLCFVALMLTQYSSARTKEQDKVLPIGFYVRDIDGEVAYFALLSSKATPDDLTQIQHHAQQYGASILFLDKKYDDAKGLQQVSVGHVSPKYGRDRGVVTIRDTEEPAGIYCNRGFQYALGMGQFNKRDVNKFYELPRIYKEMRKKPHALYVNDVQIPQEQVEAVCNYSQFGVGDVRFIEVKRTGESYEVKIKTK